MTKRELQEALAIATSDESLSDVDHSVLFGLYLPTFRPVVGKPVARLLREVAVMFNGTVCPSEVAEFAAAAQRRITVIG